jgi:hypothetical protein
MPLMSFRRLSYVSATIGRLHPASKAVPRATSWAMGASRTTATL